MILRNLNNAAFSSTAIIDSGTVAVPYSNGAVIRCYSTQAGVLKIYYIDGNAAARQAVADQTVAANDLKTVVIRIPMTPAQVTFTPSASTPGTVTVEVIPFRS